MADDNDANIAKAVALLEQTTEFRILKRLPRQTEFGRIALRDELIGIVLDIETTGLDFEVDDVIELAMTKFTFTKEGMFGLLQCCGL